MSHFLLESNGLDLVSLVPLLLLKPVTFSSLDASQNVGGFGRVELFVDHAFFSLFSL